MDGFIFTADRNTALLSTDTQAIKLVLNSNYSDEQQIAIREIRSYIWSQEFFGHSDHACVSIARY